MKTIAKTILFGLLATITSCSDSLEELTSVKSSAKNQSERSRNPIIINNTTHFVGYGYEPTTSTPKLIPFDLDKSTITQSNPNPTNTVNVDFKSIESNEDFERSFQSISKIEGGVKIPKIFSFDAGYTKKIKEKLKINRNHINVVVEMKYSIKRHILNGTPVFSQEGSNLLHSNFNEFINKYGTYYVVQNTVGGAAYYIYTYDYSRIENYTRKEVKKAITASIIGIFNGSGSRELTEEERKIIETTYVNSSQVATIAGYAPGTIQNLQHFESEKQRLASYVLANPSKQNSVDLILKSYSTVSNNNNFYIKELEYSRCMENAKLWDELRKKIEPIQLAYNPDLRSKAIQALIFLNQKYNESITCSGSVPPSLDLYADLIREFYNSFDLNILNRTVVIYPQSTDGKQNVNKYLSTVYDGTKVDLWKAVDGSGRQKWIIRKLPNGEYSISASGGVIPGRTLLSTVGNGTKVDLWYSDDNSGRQQWSAKLIKPDENLYTIYVKKGLSSGRHLLSCNSLGKVDLWSHDDGSGRQKWIIKPVN